MRSQPCELDVQAMLSGNHLVDLMTFVIAKIAIKYINRMNETNPFHIYIYIFAMQHFFD